MNTPITDDFNRTCYLVDNLVYDDREVAEQAGERYTGPYYSLEAAIDELCYLGYTHYVPKFRQNFGVTKNGVTTWQVFVDGACSGNGTRNAMAGYGEYFGANNPKNVSAPLPGPIQTNQRAELMAIQKAFELIKQYDSGENFLVYTDSAYAMDCLTKWCITWQETGWINSKGFQVANADLIQDILDLVRSYDCENVKLSKVAAHSGIPAHDEADRLAREGIYMPF